MDSIYLFQLPFVFIALAAIILGACIGSFLNVIIIRLPNSLLRNQNEFIKQVITDTDTDNNNSADINIDLDKDSDNIDKNVPYQSTIQPFLAKRSKCLHCEKQLSWIDNIPIISYILIKGRCRYCKANISKQYLLVESLTALVFLIVASICYFQHLSIIFFLSFLLFSCALISASFIDAKYKLLPDEITLPILWLGLLINISDIYTHLSLAVIGASVGYLSLWLIYQIHYAITDREGLGYGDFKFTAMLGAWFGVYALAPIMLIASLLGIAYYLISKIKASQLIENNEVPFGPFLSIAAFLFGIWTLISNMSI